VTFNNIVTNQLTLQFNDLRQDKLDIKIFDESGREVYRQNIKLNSTNNIINVNTTNISKGFYHLILTGINYKEAFPFIKS
jgi:hypothetical protein